MNTLECGCELNDYKCHYCHDGEEYEDVAEWEVVRKHEDHEMGEFSNECKWTCKCGVEYHEMSFQDSSGAGWKTWQFDKDGNYKDTSRRWN